MSEKGFWTLLVLFDLGLKLGKYTLMGLGVLYVVNFVKVKFKK